MHNTITLSKTFNVSADDAANAAHLSIAADNSADVVLNGRSLGSVSSLSITFLPLTLRAGANTISLTVTQVNNGQSAQDNPVGVLWAVATGPALLASQLYGDGDLLSNYEGCSCGDPVDNATGNFTEKANDMPVGEASAGGFAVSAARTYNSMNAGALGRFGRGWTDTYAWALAEDTGTGRVRLIEGDGATASFDPDGTGGYVSDASVLATLTKVAGGGWKLVRFPHETYTFDISGRLVSESAVAAATTTLAYAGGRLSSVTDANGRSLSYTYNTDGLVTSIAGPGGRQASYSYSNGDLAQVTDPSGAVTKMTYDAGHRMVTMTNARAQVTNTRYDSLGRVASQDVPGRGTLNWAYQANPTDGTSSTTVTDARGSKSLFQFTDNVLTAETTAAGTPAEATTQFQYAKSLQPSTVIDPRGNATTTNYDNHGNVTAETDADNKTRTFSYNGADDLVSLHTSDGTTTYGRDSDGLLTSSTDPLNRTIRYTYTPRGEIDTSTSAAGRVTTLTYDSAGNRESQTKPAGEKTTYVSDASGWTIATTSPRGNLAGSTAEDYTTHYVYDAMGRPTSVVDPRDTTTQNVYDPNGNVVETKVTDAANTVLSDATITYDAGDQPATITNADHRELSNTYDAVGNLASTVDGTAAATTFGYDARNERTAMTTPRGNIAGATAATTAAYTWSYGYDSNGNQTSVIDPSNRKTVTSYDVLNRPTSVTTPRGYVTTTTYDALSRIISTKDPLSRLTSYTYDQGGRLITATQPGLGATTFAYDNDDLQTSTTEPGSNSQTTSSYDADGRLASMTDPLGNVAGATAADYTTIYGYDADGNQTTSQDQLGRVTTRKYDANGNPLANTSPGGSTTTWSYDGLNRVLGTSDPDQRATTSTYDKYGDLVTQTDPKSHALNYAYNQRHQLISSTDQLGRTRTFNYDADGNQNKMIDPRGNVAGGNAATWTVKQTFDARNLRTGISNSADPSVNSTFGYDDDGRMTQFIDATGTTNLSYDAASQMTGVAGPDGAYSYGYTDFGAIAQRTLPSDGTVNYGFDNAGRVTSQTADALTTNYSYDANDRLTKVTQPTATGLAETLGYDRTGSITKMIHTQGATTLSQYDYALDADGNPTSLTTTRGSSSTSEAFVYDPAEQITKYCPSSSSCNGASKYINYSYDALGSMTQQNRVGLTSPGATNYTYDNAGERLTSKTPSGTTTTYPWDAAGNLINGRTWDVLGRMTVSGSGAKTRNITYNALNLRRAINPSSGSGTSYSWDLNNSIPMLGVVTHSDGSTWTNRYDPMGRVQFVRSTGQTYFNSYIFHDRLGSVTDIAGTKTGVPEWSYSYDPFGTQTTTQASSTALDVNIGFTGEYLEPDTNEYQLRARDFAPAKAQFNAVDPLVASAASPNADRPVYSRYVYANNNPLVYTDPTGLSSCGAANAVSAVLSFTHISQSGFCNFGEGGADAVGELGGGIVDGLSPLSSLTNSYNQHIGVDTCSWFYKATTVGATATSLFFGAAGARSAFTAYRALRAARGAEGALTSVDEVLAGLPKGKSRAVDLVESDSQLQELYESLTTGARRIDVQNYKGVWVERSDGVRIGMRDFSKHGGRTIDVRYPDGSLRKVHVR